MVLKLIYSCVFFSDKYIKLVELLLKSYTLFGNTTNNIEYLIICSPNFKSKIQKIFDLLNIQGIIWCLDLTTKFEAAYSRLKIFDYPLISRYQTILYLDCDILITNSISNIFDLPIENKLYVLKENHHRHYHYDLFTDKEFEDLDKSYTFTSAILLFKNIPETIKLFSDIITHIIQHNKKRLRIPTCLDQPFIIYHSIKNNIINNTLLSGIVTNGPTIYKNFTVIHFPGPYVGAGNSKILTMTKYMNDIMFNINRGFSSSTDTTILNNKSFKWENSNINFLENGRMKAFGKGDYKFIDQYLVKCDFGGQNHLLIFNKDFSTYISIRKYDFNVVNDKLL